MSHKKHNKLQTNAVLFVHKQLKYGVKKLFVSNFPVTRPTLFLCADPKLSFFWCSSTIFEQKYYFCTLVHVSRPNILI